MADDAEHGQVIEGVGVVFGNPALPALLAERDRLDRKAQFAHQPAKIRLWISDLAHLVQHHPVIEPEARGVLDDRHLRDGVQDPVVELAQPMDQQIGLAHRFYRQHNRIALLPGGQEVRDQLWRVLQVRRQVQGGIAPGLDDAPVRRP